MSKALTEKQLLIARRQKARHYAMQALYQWRMSGSSLNQIEAEFITNLEARTPGENEFNQIEAEFHTDNDFAKVDGEYFHELLHKVPAEVDELDALIEPALVDRALDEIGPVEHALLRMAIYELKHRIDVPYKVVINEAVSLAKKFGPEDSHKFVNAILDKVAAQFRAIEMQSHTQ